MYFAAALDSSPQLLAIREPLPVRNAVLAMYQLEGDLSTCHIDVGDALRGAGDVRSHA